MASPACFTQMTEPTRLRSIVARTAATSAVEHRAEVRRTAGAGEEAVDAAGRLARSRPPPRHLLLDGDVGHRRSAPVAPSAGPRGDAGRGVGQLLLGAPADRDVRASAARRSAVASPMPLPAAGDEDRPPAIPAADAAAAAPAATSPSDGADAHRGRRA